MRVIAPLLSPWYQLFSETVPRKIVGTERTIKVLLPEYQVYKCFIILNNCAIQISKLCPFLVDFLSTLVMLFKTNAFSCVHLKKKKFFLKTKITHVIKVLFTGRWIVICAIHRWIILFGQIEWNYGNRIVIAIQSI